MKRIKDTLESRLQELDELITSLLRENKTEQAPQPVRLKPSPQKHLQGIKIDNALKKDRF